MSVFSMFVSPLQYLYTGTEDIPNESDVLAAMTGGDAVKYNILYNRVDQYRIATSGQRTVVLPNIATEWVFILAKVVGTVEITTQGLDAASAAITGVLNASGTSDYPGIFMLSTNKLSSIIVGAVGAPATVELFAGIAVPDTDPRLITNA